jgi:hypothetical protein
MEQTKSKAPDSGHTSTAAMCCPRSADQTHTLSVCQPAHSLLSAVCCLLSADCCLSCHVSCLLSDVPPPLLSCARCSVRSGHMSPPWRMQWRGSCTAWSVTLLSHFCYTVVTLLSHSCYTVVTLLSHSCYTVVTLLSHCCNTVVTLLLHCCHTVVTLMLHSCYTGCLSCLPLSRLLSCLALSCLLFYLPQNSVTTQTCGCGRHRAG